MASTLSNPFAIEIRAPGVLAPSFELSSATGGTDLPFTLGFAFRQGEMPAGAPVAGSLASLQVVPKNAWPDGSLKFAIVSGRATLAAGSTVAVQLMRAPSGTSATAPVLGTDALRATGITAGVDAGSFGSAAWTGSDWNTPAQAWISGPHMSSWLYRKPIGSDPHLVAWLEVRLYAGGAVDVLPWIENGYLNLAGPTSKSATFRFTLGGTERFAAPIDLPHHCRTVLVAGTAASHWLAAAPALQASHDRAYLQATRLVPAYRAKVASSAAVWASLAQSYTPLQRGNFSTVMGNGGYQPAIGLLPEWDVLYLCSKDPRALAGVIANGYSAGRFAFHYRDENTQRPLRFSSYPNLVLKGGGSVGVTGTGASSKNQYTPLSGGTVPASYDLPHLPSVGYLAYLVTGRYYFMEEVQFCATLNFLKNTDHQRQFSAGVFLTTAGANTVRGTGWAIRTLAQAACVTPDADTALRAEFIASLAANADFYHATYVARPNNPQGTVAPYSNYTSGSGIYSEAPWQQDFFTMAFGYAIDIVPGLPAASAARLSSFFAWKAQQVIGRLGGTADNEWLFSDACPYTMAVAPANVADFTGGTGPFYASFGDMYAATLGKRNPGIAGPLRGGNFPEVSSYWGNMQPAIAYAVQHQVPGAAAAYQRLLGASNWNELASRFDATPVWSVVPH